MIACCFDDAAAPGSEPVKIFRSCFTGRHADLSPPAFHVLIKTPNLNTRVNNTFQLFVYRNRALERYLIFNDFANRFQMNLSVFSYQDRLVTAKTFPGSGFSESYRVLILQRISVEQNKR